MNKSAIHSFHIPVMGLGFTIATPIKVARFGISSVISIVEDELVEQMRKFYCSQVEEEYIPITTKEDDFRAKRVTAYLNLVNRIVKSQMEELKQLPFVSGNELTQYFEMLPDDSSIKSMYLEMLAMPEGEAKKASQSILISCIQAGSIDVNIMSKVDKINYDKNGVQLPEEFSDALCALRGYANSDLDSGIVFSAGYNPRLYGYIDKFKDFMPDENGYLKKKIILKVSDYRSALTQGKILAKKGLWVSEFRIESVLNCGGHAFVTDGLLLGAVLKEFRENKATLIEELYKMCNEGLEAKGLQKLASVPVLKITVQGGVGTANEHNYLLNDYQTDSVGWGSPFLLVPEATSVDNETLHQLATAKKEDYYLSGASPLGVPFNNFRRTTSEQQRKLRIEKNRPGSPCYKQYLVSNTEFTEQPICTASRQYLHLKIKDLQSKGLPTEEFEKEFETATEKDCLCEGLGVSALISNNIEADHNLKAVIICPGPNLAYFSGVFTLKQMVDHIYGRINILNSVKRSNMFVNELNLYTDYFKKELNKCLDTATANKVRYLKNFKTNLLKGVEYYKELADTFKAETEKYIEEMKHELNEIEIMLTNLPLPSVMVPQV